MLITNTFARLPRAGDQYVHNDSRAFVTVRGTRLGRVRWVPETSPDNGERVDNLEAFIRDHTWTGSAYYTLGMFNNKGARLRPRPSGRARS